MRRRKALTGVVAAGLIAAGGCGGNPQPETSPRVSLEPADSVLARARAANVDREDVERAQREASESVAALDEDARREFLELFGPDPLGLARVPENAVQYEISLEMNEQVEWWIDRFTDHIPDRFATYLRRLGRYGPMIREKLREAGLPRELQYLALIESGMNPHAYSRAHAVGLWQFIASTARLYGLEVSYWMDERRDPVKSTDAAVAYLEDLYEEFGSWYLAAAAYNGGPGRVRRGIARVGSEDFWDLSDARVLHNETRNYVPKLIAAAVIARNPDRYGFGDLEPEEPLEYDEVTVPDATSMDVIAEAAGTDEATIREMNPQYPRHVTPPDRKATVKIPAGRTEQFVVAYAKIPPDERVTWLVHTVTRGQTLSGIAARYGTSVRAIRAANRNVSPRRLQIGQRLVIPRAREHAAEARLAASDRADKRPDGSVTVTVRRGDTLWALARAYGVSTRQLMEWNGLESTVIRPGDRLTVAR